MKKHLVVIMILFFGMNIFNNLGHPVTPSYVRFLEIPEYMFGIFFAMMSLGMTLVAPMWGSLADSGKTKYYMAAGLLIYALAQLGFALIQNQYLMIFFRLLGGIGIAAPMTLFVSLVIGHSQENRIRNLAILAAISTLGASVGYQIGGLLGDSEAFKSILNTSSYEGVFILQSLCVIILGILVMLLVKDYEKGNIVTSKKGPFSMLARVKTLDIKLIIFLISLTLITIGSTNLSKYIDLYFSDQNISTSILGNFVLVTGIVSVITSIFIVPLVSRSKRQLSLLIGIQLLSALIVFYVFRASRFLETMYTVYNIYIMLKAIYLPLEQNYISRHANQNTIGTISGIRQSFISLGNVIGPLLGGLLYGIKPLLLFDTSAIFFLLGGLLLVIILILERRTKN